MEVQDIKKVSEELIEFLEASQNSSQNKEKYLVFLLDQISLSRHYVKYNFDEKGYPEFLPTNNDKRKTYIENMFPRFGYYNSVAEVSKNIGDTEVYTGDAIDDLFDIYLGLKEIIWRWNNTSVEDALWYFEDSFESHWGKHLRDLQLYLHSLLRDS